MKKVLAVFIGGVACLSAIGVSAQDNSTSRQIRGGVLNGKATSLPMPVYPAQAAAENIKGTVIVDVTVDEAGVVIEAKAADDTRKVSRPGMDPDIWEVPSADPILKKSAEIAAVQARFSPTLLSGVPVKVSGYILYTFSGETRDPINGGVLNGKATALPKPVYPEAAKAIRAGGAVSVEVTVDENGDVISARAVAGHPLLRAASVEAARGAKFSPTFLSGQRVKVVGVVVYNFVPPSLDPM